MARTRMQVATKKKVEKALNHLYRRIVAGCREIDSQRALVPDCKRLYFNRYSLSFAEHMIDPETWKRDKKALERAARFHGILAASIAQFSVDDSRSIGTEAFMKAGHMIEIECHAFVSGLLAKSGKKPGPLSGPWCW